MRVQRGINNRRKSPVIKIKKNKRAKTDAKRIKALGLPSGPTTSIQKSIICSDRQIVKLTYTDTTNYLMGSVASAYDINTYRINSAYDINASVGSTAIAGFVEWSNLYQVYRVLRNEVRIDFCNLDTTTGQPILCGFFPSTGSGTIASWSNVYELCSNPRCTNRLISSVGGMDRCTIRQKIDLGNLVGDRAKYLADDSYAAAINANPAILINGYVFIASGTDVAFGSLSAVAARVTMTLTVMFYQRSVLYS